MHFASALLSLAASAAVASAASVTFWSLDDTTRTVYFTGNQEVAPVSIQGGQKQKVVLNDNFIGNFYAVADGAENKPGMLGEVSFGSWGGITFFDVSAIVDPTDTNNVKQLWPAEGNEPVSGCHNFPCNNAYYLPDDVQTKATDSNELMCTLGSGTTGLSFLDV